MYDIFESIKHILKLESVCIDNNVFRLHYKASMILLLMFTILNSSKQYFGDPINCIAEGIPQKLLNTYCWITSTYTIPSKVGTAGVSVVAPGVANYVPGEDEVQIHQYYQWVGFVLFCQALLFYIPRYIWKNLEGGKIKALAGELRFISLDETAMNSKIKLICNYFENNLTYHNMYFFRFVACEILNLVNVIGQMFLMNRFLGNQFMNYGWDIISFLQLDQEDRIDPMSRIFPKITKCLLHKYGPSGSPQIYDGLCILPLNIINEKIYIFLWFWYFILAILTGLAILYRLVIICSPWLRYILLKSKYRIASSKDIAYICANFQIGDWFIFYQISHNIDQIAFKKLIEDLAHSFRNENKRFKGRNPDINLYNIGFKLDEKV